MKTRLLFVVAALAGTFALGRYFFPHPPRAPDSKPPATSAAESARSLPSGEVVQPFNGTLEDVLRVAQSIRGSRALAESLHALLDPLPSGKLAELAAAFLWEENRTWQATATCQVILECWLAKDAGAAEACVAFLPDGCRKGSLTAILASAARTDPGKAVAWAQQIGLRGDPALPEIAGELVATDPQSALKLLQADADSGDDYRYDKLFEKWTERDPAAALAGALALPKSEARTRALSSIFRKWARLDRTAAWATARAQPKGDLRNAAIQAVLGSWAHDEPKAALAAAQSLPKEQQHAAVRAVLRSWSYSDPAAAATAAAALPLTARKELNKEIAERWTERDPQAALTWAKMLSDKEGGDEIVVNMLSVMAKADGVAAAAAWSSLPFRQRSSGLYSVISEWSARDYDGAMQWAKSLEHSHDRGNAISRCIVHLNFGQSDRINALLEELPSGEFRQNAIDMLVARQCDKDVEDTLEFLGTLRPEERASTLANSGVLDALAEGNLRQTLAVMAETPGLAPSSFDWQEVVERLAGEDPAEALQWAASLSQANAKKNALDKVLTTWAQMDGPEAMRQVRLLGDPELQEEFAARVLYEWAEQDPDAVLWWAETAPVAERSEALLRGALGKAENNPAAAAAIVDSLLKESSSDSWIPGAIAEKWFSQDMDGARDWTMRLPPGKAQDEAIVNIVSTWTGTDAMAASEWVKELPPGSGRDAGALQLVNAIKESDPDSALTWAASISDAVQRDKALDWIATSLRNVSPEAARAAVDQSPLSAEKKGELLEGLQE